MSDLIEYLSKTKRKPKVGDILFDDYSREFRTVELIARINPPGDTPPYWQVKNTKTKRTNSIREDRLYDRKRWSFFNAAG